MSGFLRNLARRAAGIPATVIRPAASAPVGPEFQPVSAGLAEQASETAAPAPYEGMELRLESTPEPVAERILNSSPVVRVERILSTQSAMSVAPAPESFSTPAEPMFDPQPQPMKIPANPGVHPREGIETRQILQQRPAFSEPDPAGLEQQQEPRAQRKADPQSVEIPRTADRVVSAPMIRPAAEKPSYTRFLPYAEAPAPHAAASTPIHVRIGRVEVREAAPPAPAPTRPKQPEPMGFASYYRMRNYRS